MEDIYVYNISMSNASDGARIKVWPGDYTPFQPTLNGGGGSGYVKNVTYDTLYNSNTDWAIELTQCYGQSNQTLCNQFPVCNNRPPPSSGLTLHIPWTVEGGGQGREPNRS